MRARRLRASSARSAVCSLGRVVCLSSAFAGTGPHMGTDFQSPDDEFSRSRFAVAGFEAMVESELFFLSLFFLYYFG